MKVYFSLFIAALMIGILMIVLGTVYRKKLSSIGTVYLILVGVLVVIISVVMCLCLGFFMR